MKIYSDFMWHHDFRDRSIIGSIAFALATITKPGERVSIEMVINCFGGIVALGTIRFMIRSIGKQWGFKYKMKLIDRVLVVLRVE